MKKSIDEKSAIEYEKKRAIQKRLEDYYCAQSVKNGLSDMRKIKAYLPNEYSFGALKRDIVIAHLEFEKILTFIAEKKEFAVVSGLNPSSPLHLGHACLFEMLADLQKVGAQVYIPITNDETYVDGKVESLQVSRRMAYEKILPDILSFGFSPEKTHIYVMSDYPDIYGFAMYLSKYITLSDVQSLFGAESLQNSGQMFYRSAVQIAQILLPQLREFGGPKPTLIPVGIDQHPYVLLARDIAKKLKMIPPSELVIKFQPSLVDPEAKMSGSKPETAIYLRDDETTMRTKIKKAYTGAVSSLDAYREFGGIPDICPVFQLLNFHLADDGLVADTYTRYAKGEIMMSDLKNMTSDFICGYIGDHKNRTNNSQYPIDSFLLKQKLSSFL
jgi:tryptophanyl-tRNA synthetase